MHRRYWILIMMIGPLFINMMSSAQFWEKKPYTEWDQKEARQIVTSSPWCYEFEWANHGDIARNIRSGGDSEREYLTIFRVALFSSHTLRKAFVALVAQGDEGKFRKYKEFVDRKYGDEIVISLTIDSQPKGIPSVFEIHKQLLALRLPDLSNQTFLATDNGKKVFIKDYIPPTPDGTGAKFIFPRFLPDETPLITGEEKSLKFQTVRFQIKDIPIDEQVDPQRESPSNFANQVRSLKLDFITLDATFNIKNMKVAGRVDH